MGSQPAGLALSREGECEQPAMRELVDDACERESRRLRPLNLEAAEELVECCRAAVGFFAERREDIGDGELRVFWHTLGDLLDGVGQVTMRLLDQCGGDRVYESAAQQRLLQARGADCLQ